MSKRPNEGDERVRLLADPARQAVGSLRGYAYQVRQTVCAWLRCKDREEIYCELAEDVDKVRRDADGQISDVELNQIKAQVGAISLNSAQATETIKNFVRHRSKDPSLKILMRLWTISSRGRESGQTWMHAENGLDLWEKLQRREVSQEGLQELRQFLEGNDRLSPEVRRFVGSLSDGSFLNELVDRISWDTGQQSYLAIEQQIVELLSAREPTARDPDEARRLIDAMYRHVTDLIASDPIRILTKQNLDRLLADLREKVVPRQEFRALAANVSGLATRVAGAEQVAIDLASALQRLSAQDSARFALNEIEAHVTSEPPPLPQLCSIRTQTVRELGAECESNQVVWVHGLNGAGKSTLANLLARNSSTCVLWCRLRGVLDFELIAFLHGVIRVLRESDTNNCLVVLDDVELANQATQAMELLQVIAAVLSEKNGRLLITSQVSAPSRLASMLDGSISSWCAPRLDDREISELLRESGLEDEELRKAWAILIAARTRGHPQLVSAYLMHGRSVKWSFSGPEIFEAPDTAEKVRAEGRELLGRVGGAVCEMARRLSVVSGIFTRQFAIDLGSVSEPLGDPGGAFDSLVGPWIQPTSKDRFVLSPLLEDFAAAGLGRDGIRKYIRIASEAWLRQKTMTPEQAIQMLTTALLAPNEVLLLKVCISLVSMASDTFPIAARQLTLLVALEFGRAEPEFSVVSQFFFRYLQMKIAEENGDWKRYAALDGKLSALVEPLREGPMSVFRFAHYVFTNCTLHSPLSFQLRLRRAVEARRIQHVGFGDGYEYTVADEGYSSASLIAVAFATASNKEDLEKATTMLEALSEPVARELGEGFDQAPDLALFVTEKVWSEESKRAEPQWAACLDAFQHLTEFARVAGSQSLRAASTRGAMIVLDDFLNRSDAALDLAARFREGGETGALVDLAELGVRLRRREGGEALRLLEKVETETDPNIYAVERAMTLAKMLQFQAPTFDKNGVVAESMMRVVTWGQRIGEALADNPMGTLIFIAFQCEQGLLLHCIDRVEEAVEKIEEALCKLEEFPEQTLSVFRAVRFRIGQCCGLLGLGEWKGPNNKVPPISMIGSIADFTDPTPKVLDFPPASYPDLWGIVALYAAHAQNFKVARRCAERAFEDAEGVYFVATSQGLQAMYLCDLLENRFDAALTSGIKFTRVLAIGIASGLNADDRIRQRVNLVALFEEFEVRVREVWSGALLQFVFEPLFMTLCCAATGQHPSFVELTRIVEGHLGTIPSTVSDWLALMKKGLAAVDADESGAVSVAKAITDDDSADNADRRRLMMLACCASKALSPAELLSYQVAMLTTAISMPNSPWATCYFRMVAMRWLFVSENQKFRLSRPDRSSPKLLEAAEASLRSLDVRSCANLLIVAGDAAALSIPREMNEELARLARS
jgi:hypothetical protein